MKVGRNDPCPCGSGKKYKRCCIYTESQSYLIAKKKESSGKYLTDNQSKNEQNSLPGLNSGDIFHPVRLYYRLHDKAGVVDIFNNMQCMEFDKPKDRWVWLYTAESARLPFPATYSKYLQSHDPFILGSLFSDNDDEMFLDVRSIERAYQGAAFFNRYLDQSYAEITHAGLVNRLAREGKTGFRFRFDDVFDDKKMIVRDGQKIMDELTSLAGQTNEVSRIISVHSFLEERMQERIPEVEKVPLPFYDDGIEAGLSQLRMILTISQVAAIRRWEGHEDITQKEIFNEMFNEKFGGFSDKDMH